MTINLEPFHAPLPYPEVKNVRPDPALAAALMEGYCGERSEMTTVLQYGYHSLRCARRYRRVADMMRGIFYVETVHMELLGECVCKLGGDPRYLLKVREKAVCWQGELVSYENTPGKMLLADLEGERYAASFYQEMAGKVDQPEIAALMARLAEDEKLHVLMLSELYRKTFK